MECKRCQSGYRVRRDEKFCGFCKAPLIKLKPFSIQDDKLMYIDSKEMLTVTVRVKNVGVIDAQLNSIEFE